MVKRITMCAVALFFVAGLSLAAPQDKDKAMAKSAGGSWHGWVTDTACGAKGTSASHAACAAKCVKEKGAKWALYNTADKKVYILDPQDGAAAHAGNHVTVKGTADGDTIHVTSYKMMAEKKKPMKSGGAN